jgi:hypothetical protein
VNNVISNSVTIAVALNGNCSSAATGQPQVGPNQAYGSVTMEHIAISVPGLGSLSEPTGGASFQRNGAVAVSTSAGFPPAQAGCYIYVVSNNSSSSPTPGAATVAGSTGLDAGTITIKTPSSGTVTLTENPTGSYTTTSFPAITTGAYSASGSGGKDVGAFGPVTLNIPALMNVTNPGFTGTTFSQSNNLSPTLTCPDPAGEIAVLVGSQNASNIYGAALCTFACAGNIVVPSSVLKQLPTSAGNAGLYFIFLPPNNNAGVTSAQFTATGLNEALFIFSDIYALGQLTLTP